MCGIAGFFNVENAAGKTRKALSAMENRGLDGCGVAVRSNIFFAAKPSELKAVETDAALGHLLHSIVGLVKQPIKQHGVLAANCEIYNWRELCKRHSINAKNDAELILKLLERKDANPAHVLEELDGVWAFAYWRNGRLVLSRDILGEKPLWYSLESGLYFASERKALEAAGCREAIELDPRHVMLYDIKRNKAHFLKREFFSAAQNSLSFKQSKEKLMQLLEDAVRKRVPEKKFGLLFSGGIDSILLAVLFKKLGLKFTCFFGFVGGIGESQDMHFVKKAAEELGLELETVSIKMRELPELISQVVPLIESSNPVKVGVALPMFLACTKAREHRIKVIFSGLGADELFCGYSRFKESNNVALDSLNLLLQMHENDLYRDDVITMNNNLELRLPFLDLGLVQFALSIKKEFKISSKQNKIIPRSIAADLGLEKEFCERKKIAAQYGSNFDKAIERLAKQAKAKGKADYLAQFAKRKNLKIAALFSGGKDSCLALWIMQRQNYDVSCLVSIMPESADSYMYHQPDQKILRLQAKALQIPLIIQKTKGEKEVELHALKSALLHAKKKFGIQGVVTGALFSNYQRERIQKICLDLQLRLFSPLWHKKQEQELRELAGNKFVFVMSKIAALGLDESWLGKPIGAEEIAKLEKLSKETGFNAAGEGGEFETLVLSAPNFNSCLEIVESEKKMENEFTGCLYVKRAKLANA